MHMFYLQYDVVPKQHFLLLQMAYDVPSTARKMVFKSAAQKWREFKNRLTNDYILLHSHDPEFLELPPADYSFIEKAHWDMFVADRLSPEFKVSIHTYFIHKVLRSSINTC